MDKYHYMHHGGFGKKNQSAPPEQSEPSDNRGGNWFIYKHDLKSYCQANETYVKALDALCKNPSGQSYLLNTVGDVNPTKSIEVFLGGPKFNLQKIERIKIKYYQINQFKSNISEDEKLVYFFEDGFADNYKKYAVVLPKLDDTERRFTSQPELLYDPSLVVDIEIYKGLQSIESTTAGTQPVTIYGICGINDLDKLSTTKAINTIGDIVEVYLPDSGLPDKIKNRIVKQLQQQPPQSTNYTLGKNKINIGIFQLISIPFKSNQKPCPYDEICNTCAKYHDKDVNLVLVQTKKHIEELICDPFNHKALFHIPCTGNGLAITNNLVTNEHRLDVLIPINSHQLPIMRNNSIRCLNVTPAATLQRYYNPPTGVIDLLKSLYDKQSQQQPPQPQQPQPPQPPESINGYMTITTDQAKQLYDAIEAGSNITTIDACLQTDVGVYNVMELKKMRHRVDLVLSAMPHIVSVENRDDANWKKLFNIFTDAIYRQVIIQAIKQSAPCCYLSLLGPDIPPYFEWSLQSIKRVCQDLSQYKCPLLIYVMYDRVDIIKTPEVFKGSK